MTEKKKPYKQFNALKFSMLALCGLGAAIFVLQIICFCLQIDGNVTKTCYGTLGGIGGAFTAIMVIKIRGAKKDQ